jgi:hypothetical protein
VIVASLADVVGHGAQTFGLTLAADGKGDLVQHLKSP